MFCFITPVIVANKDNPEKKIIPFLSICYGHNTSNRSGF